MKRAAVELVIGLVLLPAAPATAQQEKRAGPVKRVIRPEGYRPTPAPLTPAILVGDTLYLSGSTGGDPATGELVKGGLEPEIRQIFSNVRTVLKAAGMDLADVVAVTTYLVDMADYARYNEIYREHFQAEPLPTRSTVAVKELARGARVEMTMTAFRAGAAGSASLAAANPLWREEKVKNYLPHMTWPEVEDLLRRTDMAILPMAALEQHGPQLPIGTDFLNGLERAKLVAQRTDVLVAPVLHPGNSPYHMGFPGTMTLPAETIQRVYFEAAQSLLRHGFRRFLILNSHGGNQAIARYVVDRINQETAGIAVELGEAAEPFLERPRARAGADFDRHGGVGETSASLYLTPSLVDLSRAKPATLTMPDHLQRMVPDVVAGDSTATRVFLAEGLKARETGKGTSAREMSSTGVWSARDPAEATAERGRREAEAFVSAAVKFIERWKQLRPVAK